MKFQHIAFWAALYSLALSMQPLARIYPALLNELLAASVWGVASVCITWKYMLHASFLNMSRPLWMPLLVMIVSIFFQYVVGVSVPYGGLIAQHIFSLLLACFITVCGSALCISVRNYDRTNLIDGLVWIVVIVVSVQAVFAWLQYLEMHLYFPFIKYG